MTNLRDLIHRRLLDFQADGPDPRWSSHTLNELFSSAISKGGNVGDILQTLFPLLDQSQLSPELANFNKDVATCAFSSYQESYHKSSLQWMCDAVRNGCTAPQAYLALYSMPPQLLDAECVVSIFKALAATPFWPEAVANLEDATGNTQAQDLLTQWLSSNIEPECRPDVERMVKIGQ